MHGRDALVTACGRVCVHRRNIDGSTVMAGQRPGLEEVGDGLRVVTFMTGDTDDRDFMDLEQKDPQPADNRLGAKVLPVSQAGLVLSPMSPGRTLIGGFTRNAEDFARMQERRKITLIDLDRLVELWIEFYPKLDDLARDRLRLTPVYILTPRG